MNPPRRDRANEQKFQDAIIAHMVADGWIHNREGSYDRANALYPKDLLDFVKETQDEQWQKFCQLYPNDPEQRFIERVATRLNKADPNADDTQTRRFGTLGVLRHPIRDRGTRFYLCRFKPEHDLNPKTLADYQCNRLRIVPELVYSPWANATQLRETGRAAKRWRIDLVLFVNGLPVVTMELKSEFKQSVESAMVQYQKTRLPIDPATKNREPLLTFKRGALVHFAVSQTDVYMTTRLNEEKTRFLPFNKGTGDGGAGNDIPENPQRTATDYLWREVLQRDNLLDILARFVHLQIDDDPCWQGLKRRKEKLIFPRYHQWQVVKKLLRTVQTEGAGRRYLIQHSAGSGKSNSIAWLSHQLAALHTADGDKLFHSVIIVTDRTVLDDQLQDTIYQFEHEDGVVGRITRDSGSGSKSEKLAGALEANQPIIIVTIQTFPFVLDAIEDTVSLKERRYAVIADEAHTSQTGKTARRLREVLQVNGEENDNLDAESMLAATLSAHRVSPNLSYFAFTATPKTKTLELFGRCPNPNEAPSKSNLPEPFDVYTMRQAIEEGFILDVLQSYTNYKVAYQLALKVQAADQQVDSKRARVKLNQWMRLHDYNIAQKVKVIVEHFKDNVLGLLNGQAKAMVVTGSRKEAVRYKLLLDKYIKQQGYDEIFSLGAFSGEVTFTQDDPNTEDLVGRTFTEANINQNLNGRGLAEALDGGPFNIMIVANKFQTGFDQPKLCAMYVDKKLAGVECVQTLSRLNRTYPTKAEAGTFILDFYNEPEDIKAAFQPYYQTAELLDVSDPDQIFDLYEKLRAARIFELREVQHFAEIYFNEKMKLINAVRPAADRWRTRYVEAVAACASAAELLARCKKTGDAVLIANAENELKQAQKEKNRLDLFKKDLATYVRFYEFMSMIVDYDELDLEKLSMFARHLLPLLREARPEQDEIDLENVTLHQYRLSRIRRQEIRLAAEADEAIRLKPGNALGTARPKDHKEEFLSQIIARLNEIFDTEDLTEGDLVGFATVISNKLRENEAVMVQLANNSKEQALLGTFPQAIADAIMDCDEAHRNQRDQLAADPNKMLQFHSVAYDLTKGNAALTNLQVPVVETSSMAGTVLTHPSATARFRNCVPLVDIEAAAGAFSASQDSGLANLLEAETWVTVAEGLAQPNRFAAKVVGRSMEPMIPDGALCLFGPIPAGSKNGLPILVLLHDLTDPEHGGRYTVKIYRSEKRASEDGVVNTRITLEPKNPAYAAMMFTEEAAQSLHAVGRFLAVLPET